MRYWKNHQWFTQAGFFLNVNVADDWKENMIWIGPMGRGGLMGALNIKHLRFGGSIHLTLFAIDKCRWTIYLGKTICTTDIFLSMSSGVEFIRT